MRRSHATNATISHQPSTPRVRRGRWLRRLVLAIAIVVAAYPAFDAATRIDPPELPPPAPEDVRYDGETARVGEAYLARRGALWVMQVAGDPVALGYRHARLASPLKIGRAHV